MITVKTEKGTLVVDSNYDSGTHKSFSVKLIDDSLMFQVESLDQVLNKGQIKSLEAILLCMVKGYLEGSENDK